MCMMCKHAYVVFCQKAGDEFEIVVKVKATVRLEAHAVSTDGGSFGQLFHAAHPTKLAMRVLSVAQSRRPSRSAAVVVVAVGGLMRLAAKTGRGIVLVEGIEA